MNERLEKQAVVLSKILLNLAESGIEAKKLSISDLEIQEADQGLFIDAMQWLSQEQFLYFERQSNARFLGCRISAKGLSLLGAEIEFGAEKLEFTEAARQVSSGQVDSTRAGQFLGGFFAGMIKGLG